MKSMICKNYVANISDSDIKIFLDKEDLFDSNGKEGEILFSIKKYIYDEKNILVSKKKLKFNIFFDNITNDMIKTINEVKKADIFILNGECLIYALEATIIENK